MDYNKLIQTRTEYINSLRMEMLGPGSEISIPDKEHELISDVPEFRYSMGVLFPKNLMMKAENDDAQKIEENAHEDENPDTLGDKEEGNINHYESKIGVGDAEDYLAENIDNLDDEVSLASQNMPSSMGFTFFVKGNADNVSCHLSFAQYRRAAFSDCRVDFSEAIETGFSLPDELKSYIFIDEKEKTLKLLGPIKRKDVSRLREKDILEGDTDDVIYHMYALADQCNGGYVRIPFDTDVLLEFGEDDYIDKNSNILNTCVKITALRRHIKDSIYAITVMLVNDLVVDGQSKDKFKGSDPCIFQPCIRIESDKNSFIFVEYSSDFDSDEAMDEEEQSLELQYRNKKVYGTGMGTSVFWEIDSDGRGYINNEFMPEYEIPSIDFQIGSEFGVDNQVLSMKFLSDLDETDKEEKCNKLSSLTSGYEKWIEKLKNESLGLEEKFKSIANKNIEGCIKSLDRMRQGVALLRENREVWNAFQLANRAMFMQRVHLKIQEKTSDKPRYPGDIELSEILDSIDYRNVEKTIFDRYEWRPFQLAFMLMSIKGIVDDTSTDRELVDLIWFPTGGGKTEAYLLLTAFTIFYRRLVHINESGGTAIIMRYTLRLLAAQQFTRASTLICACEFIRNDAVSVKSKYGRYNLGKEKITIGLWIGGEHTPNVNVKALSELNELAKSSISDLEYNKERHNKFQVLKCPWCGTKLVKDRLGERKLVGEFGYRMRDKKHFEIFCTQDSCFFGQQDKLPIQVVDEELYRKPPTLLFGTVDKFAMLPWNSKIGSFFAADNVNRAPELIIQDELHLISGPLGTMVGLYETAIDEICKNKGVSTKIIASTATIRRAVQQCAALYNREVAQFPHPGLNAEDSFFARDNKVDLDNNKYGRRYVGLMPSGKTKAMMEIRTLAGLLQKIHEMNIPDDIKDKFWTLTVYFNSLRDLGKCSTLVDDDVKDFIKKIAYRSGKTRRIITNADELTSRVSTTQLNETLDKLEKISYSQENINNKRWPSNILLATNMISVGIDVARLNVMTMIGQPKLTSEYIQATSRVGRSFPGVVLTVYDASKSRDRSHYEQFVGYHSSYYRYVEPTGITPFSKPARERALHAVVIAILRQLSKDLAQEKDAGKFESDKYSELIESIINSVVLRGKCITEKINPNMHFDEDSIRSEIETFISEWDERVKEYGGDAFGYGERYLVRQPAENEGRLMKVYNTSFYDNAKETMTSMRNVDATARSNVLIWEE